MDRAQPNTQRTPGPWKVNENESMSRLVICSDSVGKGYFSAIASVTQRDPNPLFGGGITQPTAEANAAFIVTACNAHDDLVAVLEDLAIRAERARVILQEDGTHSGGNWGMLDTSAARAALAKAQGGAK